MPNLPRRSVLSALAAAIGVGGLAGAAPAAAQTGAAATRFVLYGSGLQLLGVRTPLTPGSTQTVRGTVQTAADGPALGQFYAHGTVLAPRRLLDPEVGTFETHLFTLADGTITGSGTVHHDGTGSFTVTGGSGRYAAARGTYTSRQAPNHSGTGTAVFAFVIG